MLLYQTDHSVELWVDSSWSLHYKHLHFSWRYQDYLFSLRHEKTFWQLYEYCFFSIITFPGKVKTTRNSFISTAANHKVFKIIQKIKQKNEKNKNKNKKNCYPKLLMKITPIGDDYSTIKLDIYTNLYSVQPLVPI